MANSRCLSLCWGLLVVSFASCAPSVTAQEPGEPGEPESLERPEQQAAGPEEEVIEGYPLSEVAVGTPTDVIQDLNTSFPKPDSVLPGYIPNEYFQLKEDLYEKFGLKFAISYQGLYQYASDTTTSGLPLPSDETDFAAGGWLLIEGKWEAINRGGDWQGSLVSAFDWRHGYGNAAEPVFSLLDTGSLWATDLAQLQWDPWFPVLYWEQWAKKDRFVLRVGNQVVSQIFDFFRFKDPRSSFTSSQLTAAAGTLPFAPPGLGAAFEWWPIEGSRLYVVGTVNDQNAEIEEYTWDDTFDHSEFFYGLEVGYNWVRGPGDFDHVHLNLFYADDRDSAHPVFANEAGGGFKVAGSKQWGRIVNFANYTYNTAEGGGFGLTLQRHAVNAGVAYLKPFGIRGELALAGSWAEPIQNFGDAPAFWDDGRDQYGIESYWKILLTPDLWVTPGVQMLFDPTFNPDRDFLTIAQIKFRLFF